MVERIGSHKKLKGLSALGASALFMAACNTGTDVKPLTAYTTASPESTPIQTPNFETPQPTQVAKETPQSTETPLSMEQLASNAVFDHWLSLLNKTQKISSTTDIFFLKTEAINFDAWKENIEKIKHGDTINDQLTVDWIGGGLYYDNSGSKASGIKSQGRFMITNLRLTTEAAVGVTNAQRDQGITWAGTTTFEYDVAWAENQYWPTNGDLYVKPNVVEKWILQKEPENLLDNSPINTVTLRHDVVLKDGKFIDIDTKEYADDYPPLTHVEKPVVVMGDPSFCQNPNAVSTCRVFNFTSY